MSEQYFVYICIFDCSSYIQMFSNFVKALVQAGGLRVRVSIRSLNLFSIYIILLAALGLGVYSASNRNEAEKLCSWGVERGRYLVLTTIPPSVSRFSRQCGILISHNLIGLHGLLRDSFTLWRRSVLPVRYELDCKYCYK
jgi:hypothetical protein